MKPNEFWDSEYKSMKLYCDWNLERIKDNYIKAINLEEASTNKMISASPLTNKKPKVTPITKVFKRIFDK